MTAACPRRFFRRPTSSFAICPAPAVNCAAECSRPQLEALVALAPLPGRHEGAGPDTAVGGLRVALLGIVGEAAGDRPALAHEPSVDARAVRERAGRERALIAVEAEVLAVQLLPVDVRPQL